MQIIKRLGVQTVAFNHAVRYVRDGRRLHIELTKQADQNSRGANSVGVVVAVHRDAFALLDPTIQNTRDIVGAIQGTGIVHQGQWRLIGGEQLRVALSTQSATTNHPLAQSNR